MKKFMALFLVSALSVSSAAYAKKRAKSDEPKASVTAEPSKDQDGAMAKDKKIKKAKKAKKAKQNM